MILLEPPVVVKAVVVPAVVVAVVVVVLCDNAVVVVVLCDNAVVVVVLCDNAVVVVVELEAVVPPFVAVHVPDDDTLHILALDEPLHVPEAKVAPENVPVNVISLLLAFMVKLPELTSVVKLVVFGTACIVKQLVPDILKPTNIVIEFIISLLTEKMKFPPSPLLLELVAMPVHVPS
ncbi:MAG: hypothetical protein HQK92_06465 [Nitrospirae bacterium]|nr:hypothetical protein [Nitrospirota bacterium]